MQGSEVGLFVSTRAVQIEYRPLNERVKKVLRTTNPDSRARHQQREKNAKHDDCVFSSLAIRSRKDSEGGILYRW